MKFLVFGAGVLGCNLANNLFRAGKDVTLLARGPWADEIRRNGIVAFSETGCGSKIHFPAARQSTPFRWQRSFCRETTMM